MILGIISDIQANILALDAVLTALEQRGVDEIICLGDLVGYGPYPDAVISVIRKRHIPCTLGSADEQLIYGFAAGEGSSIADTTIEWTRRMTKPESLEFLKTLPVQQRLHTPYGRMRFFHGTLESNATPLDLSRSDNDLMRELDQARCKIIACGKTHVPGIIKLANGYIVNPGSVGLSLSGKPGADYAVLNISETAVHASLHKVPYDYNAVAFDIDSWDLPEVIAYAIRHGKMVSPQEAAKDKKRASTPPAIGRNGTSS
ncbi:MAG: metallophosphoesterase family protein [Deinococcota bacterium]